MHTTLDCLPCYAAQACDAVRRITSDPREQMAMALAAIAELPSCDVTQPPVVLGQRLHRRLRALAGRDPFAEMKQQCNALAAAALPEAREIVRRSSDPFETALRFAIAGNTIDAGLGKTLDATLLHEALDSVARTPLDPAAVQTLRESVASARDVLFLGDNTGEIYFDRLLIEQMPREKITYAVRGAPVINDATLDDARAAGLFEIVPVIDNGSDAPGTVLSDCAPAFRERFAAADLIVAKGQGNFESLHDQPRPIFFLLRAKCRVIASHLDCPMGAFIIRRPSL